MKKGVYAGSFDPFTRGHMGIVTEALLNLDTLYILVANNPEKKYNIPSETRRMCLIKEALQDYARELSAKKMTPNEEIAYEKLNSCIVDSTDSLTVVYAQRVGARELIRGLRPMGDFEAEMKLDQINRLLAQELNHPIRTTFIATPNLAHCYTSSSLVNNLRDLNFTKSLTNLVFPSTLPYLNVFN